MKTCLLLLAFCFLTGCSGTHSTLREGFAFDISRSEADHLVNSTLRAHIAADYLLPSGNLVASGYTRFVLDTHTYTLSALPVKAPGGYDLVYALEVHHEGTRSQGPGKAKKIYKDALRRADLLGARVEIAERD